ncbi:MULTISPECIES: HvfC/BufC family peptide modification chaperone [Photorhabdus]|uniref:Putative DNA-binding domain-containing protein n=2 Tax=Photorhabdus asymbiotica TaxID=291112 RepID=C7BMX8_PHOAA|nr:putative DNA-binding domain-containing protein [Photorhabdus asymbiotica]RKS57719.1 hypothetical protein BDD30_2530 [Photorhabdus asymbiotica]CAQ82964.1 conserved hypothetical protein [Photorhabdus asymbiotica]
MKAHHSVPVLLSSAEEAFSTLIRTRNIEGKALSPGEILYRKIIRENIDSVLQSVFPLFCQNISGDCMCTLVNDFIYAHCASQPEFHQIATELLIFICHQKNIPLRYLALLEYEWLIYSIEIDDSNVSKGQKIISLTEKMHCVDIIINPTLKITCLPFQIKKGKPCYENFPLMYYYIIYRKRDNSIYQKNINDQDLKLISEINGRMTVETFIQRDSLSLFSDENLMSWLETNSSDEVLLLKYRG